MKIIKNENNHIILEHNNFTYLISYNSVVAKVCNTMSIDNNEYGLYLTIDWDYSKTTLKNLYEFIELYTTQRDTKGNMFAYQLDREPNKHQYIEEQLNNNTIKYIREKEM